MSGLDVHQKRVAQDVGVRFEKSQSAAKAQQGKVVERLLGINDVGMAQHAIGTTDLVSDHFRIVFEELLAGILLMLGHLRDDSLKAPDDGFLAFAQGGLVGDLIEMAQRLGAFAVQPAHGEADFTNRLEDLADLVAQHQPGQMEHG